MKSTRSARSVFLVKNDRSLRWPILRDGLWLLWNTCSHKVWSKSKESWIAGKTSWRKLQKHQKKVINGVWRTNRVWLRTLAWRNSRIHRKVSINVLLGFYDNPNASFGYVDLKKCALVSRRRWCMGRLFADSEDIHDHLMNGVCISSDLSLDLVQEDLSFGALQFTVDEVQSVLMELDVN
jgi:hypothetical protein